MFFLKVILNSKDFDKEIFLHVTPLLIIVFCKILAWSGDSLECCILSKSQVEILEILF